MLMQPHSVIVSGLINPWNGTFDLGRGGYRSRSGASGLGARVEQVGGNIRALRARQAECLLCGLLTCEIPNARKSAANPRGK